MAEKSSNTQNNQPTNSSGATSGNAASGTSNTSSINPTNVRQRAQSHNGTVSQSHRRLQSPAHNAPITTSSTPKSNRRQNRSSNEPVSQHRSVANVSNGRQERGATVNPNVAVNVAKERGDSEVDDILEPKEPSEHDPQNVDEVESSGSGPMNPLQELAVANSPAQNNLESGKVSEVVDQGATQEVPFNWQASKKTLKERMKFMFNNDIMADVYFIVGKGDYTQRIPAHKFILATGSAVFDAMFNGAMASYSLEEEIPDVEPSAFLALLRFLYSDEVIIDPETVMTTLYTAKKYAVPALEKACVDFLKQNLSSDNAFMLLTQARLFDEPQLASLCLETIDKNTTEALNAEGFTDIDLQTLCVVLERDTLGIRECKLFNAVCKWAEVECARKELPINNANKRECLGHALELIRFPLMTVEEFAQGPAQSSILTDREVVQLFLHFTVNPKPQVVFKDTPRCCLTGKEQVVSRFIQIENRWGYSGTSDRIRFQVNRKIFIVGFGLYGSIHGSAEYQCNIQVILTDSGKVCGQNDSNFQCDGSMTTFRVMFKEPVEILPNTTYTASATLKGPDSYYGTKGLRKVTHESVSSGKVTFAFSYAAGNNNGTSVEDGQLPEIIFYT